MYLERLRIFLVRLFTGMDRNGPNNRYGLKSTSIFMLRLYKDREAFNSYRKCFFYSENIAKFGQMNILTHENVTLYGGVITCLLACDSVCSTRR